MRGNGRVPQVAYHFQAGCLPVYRSRHCRKPATAHPALRAPARRRHRPPFLIVVVRRTFLGRSWAPLGAIFRPSELFCDPLGPSWCTLGPPWGPLWGFLGRLGAVFGASWAKLLRGQIARMSWAKVSDPSRHSELRGCSAECSEVRLARMSQAKVARPSSASSSKFVRNAFSENSQGSRGAPKTATRGPQEALRRPPRAKA